MPLLGSFGAGGARNFGFTAGGGPYAVDYVVVAGGGNSLSSSYAFGTGGGGGGAGGYRVSYNTGSYDEPSVSEVTVDRGTAYTITVGGAAGTSSFDSFISSAGGGQGKAGGSANPGGSGGSGGGAAWLNHGGNPAGGQGPGNVPATTPATADRAEMVEQEDHLKSQDRQ